MIGEAWGVQKRVWGAIFMREIQVRWGRRNLGFAWLFAEPRDCQEFRAQRGGSTDYAMARVKRSPKRTAN
jgi:hypothetical protein